MDPLLATLLRNARDNYNYAWARVTGTPAAGTAPLIQVSASLAWYTEQAVGVTNLALDKYHHDLLVSPTECDRLLGAVSTIFWGHLSRNAEFARNKALQFWEGNDLPSASGKILSCLYNCTAGDWAAALASLHLVNQLQRLPFASKIVAFVDPENAGVYDNRINSFLSEMGLDETLLGPDGAVACPDGTMREPQVSIPANQRRYANWCLRLRQIRDELNVIPISRWTCTETGPQHWRAVDVERAIFAVAAIPAAAGAFVLLLRDFLNAQPLMPAQAA